MTIRLARFGGRIHGLLAQFRKLTRDQRGVTALEYAFIASVIVVVVSSFMPHIGSALSTVWTEISTALG